MFEKMDRNWRCEAKGCGFKDTAPPEADDKITHCPKCGSEEIRCVGYVPPSAGNTNSDIYIDPKNRVAPIRASRGDARQKHKQYQEMIGKAKATNRRNRSRTRKGSDEMEVVARVPVSFDRAMRRQAGKEFWEDGDNLEKNLRRTSWWCGGS